MLTLTRRKGERLNIGLSVEITVLEISGGRVRLGITAPRRLPVHRGEILSRMALANQAALTTWVESPENAGAVLQFPEGLIGLPEHKEFILCEAADQPGLHVLVSKLDSCIQLPLVEARAAFEDYPLDEARTAAELEGEETAVAVVVTLPAPDGQPTANLQAPIVIGSESRRGRQVILFRDDLPLRHPVQLPPIVNGPVNPARSAQQP